MGTTAQKLTYLNDTKQLLKENINNLGGNLTNEPFRQYASVLEGIYERLPKVSGIGASLNLSPSMVGKIKLNEIQGDTLQNGTPTPSSPVPIQNVTGLQNVEICGKNIWCFKDSNLYRLDANSYNILGNNSVEVTSTSGTWRSVKFLLNVPDGSYTFSVGNVINSNSNVTNKRMTLSTFTNNGATRTVIKHINMGTPETITITNETDKIYALEFYSGHDASLSNTATYEEVQVVKGSTETEYEPYKGNTYEVNLDPNIYDFKYTNDGYIYTGNCNVSVSDKTYIVNATSSDAYVWLIQNTGQSYNPNSGKLYEIKSDSYTITLNSAFNKNFIALYDENKVCLSRTQYNSNEFTITPPSNAKYFCLRFGISNSVSGNTYQTSVRIVETSKANFTPIELDDEDSIKKSTGKNLFNINATTSISGGTKTNNVITSSSYSSGTWKGMDVNFPSIPINKEFTISMDLRLTSGSTGTFSKFNDGVNNFTEITKPTISQNWQRYSYKYTPSSGYSISKIFIQMSAIDGQFECRNIQIKKGFTALPYEPYGKVWYIENETKNWKTNNPNIYLINGSDGSASSSPTGLFQIFVSDLFTDFINETMLSSKFKYQYDSRINNNINANTYLNDNSFCIRQGSSNDRIYFKSSALANKTISEAKAILGSLDLTYITTTPTYEIITNTELINQLETLYNAKSKNGTTNITITSEDLSMILNVGVLKGDA